MQFTFKHTNFNVLDLQRSMDFYKEALGLTEVSRIENPDFTIVYLGDGVSDFQLELTWLKDRKEPYNLGENEFHTAFAVKDMKQPWPNIKTWAVSSIRIRPWVSISSSIPTATGWKSFRSANDEERVYATDGPPHRPG